MFYYYQNPKTRDLIIFDSEDSEVLVLSRMTKVRMFDDREPIDDYLQEKFGKRKVITAEVKTEVIKLKTEGKTIKEIGKIIGISKASICTICKEGVWKKL